jgi:putative phosphoesterase
MNRKSRIEHVELPANCRLALISDTHVYPNGQRVVPEPVLNLFARAGVARIVHGGDVSTQSVLDQLSMIAPVHTVRGNNDTGSFGDSLPERIEFHRGPLLIRLVHGHGGRSARTVAAQLATGADCVIYGHSHIPMVERRGEAIVVNPGSPNDRRWHPHFGVAFLEIREGRIRPELILFTDSRDLDKIVPGWSSDAK